MGDQAALQEAIQRARQLAAKISTNAPVKRPASDMDDPGIGTVKVTLAYEKPAASSADNHRPSADSHRHSSDSHRSSADVRRSSSSHREPSRENTEIRPYNTELIIPHAVIGLVIGKGGENIKRIQNETGATVRVDPNTVDEKGNKVCTITGTRQAVEEAHNQVSSVIENAATNKRPRTQVEGSEQYRMKIPASRTGAIIGKGGDTIKSIKSQSGCDIELDKNAKECGPDESVFIIRGTQDKILKARALIESRLASRGRDGDRDSYHRSSSGPKGVATGANAAPVAPYTDLPAAATGGHPQNSAEVSAAWAAYVAQYSNLINQSAGATTGALPGYPGQPGLGGMGAQAATQAVAPTTPMVQPTQMAQAPQAAAAAAPAQDFSDQWIEFYLANGRPDYANQVIELKKQQQQQNLLNQHHKNDNINDQNEH